MLALKIQSCPSQTLQPKSTDSDCSTPPQVDFQKHRMQTGFKEMGGSYAIFPVNWIHFSTPLHSNPGAGEKDRCFTLGLAPHFGS